MKNKTIKILFHNISYWYSKSQEMPEVEQDHVQKMIIKGYSEGELNYLMPDGNTENRGYWSIVK